MNPNDITVDCNHPEWAKEQTVAGCVCRICHPKPTQDDREFF